MRERGRADARSGEGAGDEVPLRSREQIRLDLERRGVAPEFSRPVAERLAPVVSDLHEAGYRAVLQAVAASHGVHQDDLRALGHRSADIEQIQRLMRGFAGELRKLEEAIRILNAYVTRMRTRAMRERPRTLH